MKCSRNGRSISTADPQRASKTTLYHVAQQAKSAKNAAALFASYSTIYIELTAAAEALEQSIPSRLEATAPVSDRPAVGLASRCITPVARRRRFLSRLIPL
jgi:hypothetical protein